MRLDPDWRILTIGDGDLSFSTSLLKHHNPKHLTASVYDSLSVLESKYGLQHYQTLHNMGCTPVTEVDVTAKDSLAKLPPHRFDLVIFQFPLIPGFTSRQEFEQKAAGMSINTLNRALLRQFLLNAFETLLDPNGPQLCYITSKDVKPYREWNIEFSLHQDSEIEYLGAMDFDIQRFPGYRIRNVDKDNFVPDTRGITYVWSLSDKLGLRSQLRQPTHTQDNACHLCRTGPFYADKDLQQHINTKRHQRMLTFEQQWTRYLQGTN